MLFGLDPAGSGFSRGTELGMFFLWVCRDRHPNRHVSKGLPPEKDHSKVDPSGVHWPCLLLWLPSESPSPIFYQQDDHQHLLVEFHTLTCPHRPSPARGEVSPAPTPSPRGEAPVPDVKEEIKD